MKKSLLFAALLGTFAIGLSTAAFKASLSIRTEALTATEGDPTIDVGLHVQSSSEADGSWTLYEPLFNNANNSPAAGGVVGTFANGDYMAWRIKCESTTGTWAEFMVNLTDGNCWRPDGTRNDYAVKKVDLNGNISNGNVRAQHTAWFLSAGFDGWLLVEKSAFTQKQYGSGVTPNWNSTVWGIRYCFYATTNDNINFDLGDIYSANIVDNKMVLVNHVIDWASTTAEVPTLDNMASYPKMSYTRNNYGLLPAIQLSRKLDAYDSCDESSCTAGYAALQDEYAALDSTNKSYFDTIMISDYANGDTTHAGGKVGSFTAGQKWAAIVKMATSGSSSNGIRLVNKNNTSLIILISTISILSVGALAFLIIRKRRALNK